MVMVLEVVAVGGGVLINPVCRNMLTPTKPFVLQGLGIDQPESEQTLIEHHHKMCLYSYVVQSL